MKPSVNIFWFRRDIRLHDNAGLYQALSCNKPVLPIFIFDTNILQQLDDPADRRVEFIHRAVETIKKILKTLGSDLLVLHDNPVSAFKKLIEEYDIENVYANRDYEPYARERDAEIETLLHSNCVLFQAFKDHLIFEPTEILKGNKEPYLVFTPYYKKWRDAINGTSTKSFSRENLSSNFLRNVSFDFPSLQSLGFKGTGTAFSPPHIDKKILHHYDQQRDFISVGGTSRLSVHLRFGSISIRQLLGAAIDESEKYLSELAWREYYSMILFHFPDVVKRSYRPLYDNIEWRNNESEFAAWCKGVTGYPIVDAGMRELNETGFIHNRVRMNTASFLVKHLLIDWRWGEAYFAQKLLDYELASNNGNWQWIAGCGADAAPYFRIFNPTTQAQKFDPDQEYVKRWVPELNSESYQPIVDHAFARQRCLRAYQKALRQ